MHNRYVAGIALAMFLAGLGAISQLAVPDRVEAFARTGLPPKNPPQCWHCGWNKWVQSCDGCDSANGGGECNECGSCQNSCGSTGSNGACYCDDACASYGDCCHDFYEECSCFQKCGGAAGSCWCDQSCHDYGDCCESKVYFCGQCDPDDEPCHNGNSCCFHGHDCCGDDWVCRGDASESACN